MIPGSEKALACSSGFTVSDQGLGFRVFGLSGLYGAPRAPKPRTVCLKAGKALG